MEHKKEHKDYEQEKEKQDRLSFSFFTRIGKNP
jgi:hypothetical protein